MYFQLSDVWEGKKVPISPKFFLVIFPIYGTTGTGDYIIKTAVFRIRIGSKFDQVSGSGSRSGSRRAKMTHNNKKS
jgi:hypothetical protein